MDKNKSLYINLVVIFCIVLAGAGGFFLGLHFSKENIVNSTKENTDIFSCLNIPQVGINSEVTDLDKNKFMKKSFEEINKYQKGS